jgi:hypothetical protein
MSLLLLPIALVGLAILVFDTIPKCFSFLDDLVQIVRREAGRRR